MSLNMHESPLFSRNKKTETEEMGAQKMGQNIRLLLGGKLTLSIFERALKRSKAKRIAGKEREGRKNYESGRRNSLSFP